MNKELYLLIDYKKRFGSRDNSKIYRSGMDKDLLKRYFSELNYDIRFIDFTDIDFRENYKNQIFLYTSQEDPDYYYKSYIEDIIYGLHLKGALVIPIFKYLRANNNKVFMEILRDCTDLEAIKKIRTKHFGTKESLEERINLFQKKYVLKSFGGASSHGVFLGENKTDILKKAALISRSKNLFAELWEIARSKRHSGYKKHSRYRKKFIAQNFINGLKNDWKVLVYGYRYYILYRPNRKNDFRASGSGHDNYLYNEDTPIPTGIFDFAESVFKAFKVPNLSIDIAYKDGKFYLLEFQAVYFGSATQTKSIFYHQKEGQSWEKIYKKLDLEKVYADSIDWFFENELDTN